MHVCIHDDRCDIEREKLPTPAHTCVWERERYKDKTEREKAHIQEHTEKRKKTI